MREILFRGKRVDNGEWVDGSLFIDEDYNKHEILVGYVNYRVAWEVIPETVGQFTGFTDNHGKRIFEGDVLRAMVNEREESNELMEFGLSDKPTKVPTGKKVEAFWSVEWKQFRGSVGWRAYGKNRRFNCQLTPNAIFNSECEVIGNIHDNPELLKGE